MLNTRKVSRNLFRQQYWICFGVSMKELCIITQNSLEIASCKAHCDLIVWFAYAVFAFSIRYYVWIRSNQIRAEAFSEHCSFNEREAFIQILQSRTRISCLIACVSKHRNFIDEPAHCDQLSHAAYPMTLDPVP